MNQLINSLFPRNFRFEHHTCPMRFYGVINLITMFWYMTRKWGVTRFSILVLTRPPWMIRHVCQLVNWTCGQNATVPDSAIAPPLKTPPPKNLSNVSLQWLSHASPAGYSTNSCVSAVVELLGVSGEIQ